MTMEKAIRWLAVSCMIGGFFRALMAPLAMAWGMNNVSELTAGVLGTLFMGIGAFGLYFFQPERWGKVGFAGFAMHAVGSFLLMAMVFATLVFAVYDPEVLSSDTPPLPIMVSSMLMMPTLMGSMLVIGGAVLKKKTMSAIPAVLLILSPILNFVPVEFVSTLSPLTWGAAFILFGAELYRNASPARMLAHLDAKSS